MPATRRVSFRLNGTAFKMHSRLTFPFAFVLIFVSTAMAHPAEFISKDYFANSIADKEIVIRSKRNVIATAEAAVEVFDRGVSAANNALDLYNKIYDQVMPWKKLEEALKVLDERRDDYSVESGSLLGVIKTLIMNALDQYFQSTQVIFEWCGVAVELLRDYLELFDKIDESTFNNQKAILIEVLSDGITKMEQAQKNLGESSSSFNDASGKLASLNVRLTHEFDSKSEYFKQKRSELERNAGTPIFLVTQGFFCLFSDKGFAKCLRAMSAISVLASPEFKAIRELGEKMETVKLFYTKLKETTDATIVDIRGAKRRLGTEIRNIGDLKVTTQTTRFRVTAYDVKNMQTFISTAINKLIEGCKNYRERHRQASITN